MAVLAYPALAFVGLVLVYGFMLFAVFALEGGRVPASPFR
jgi:hypothetical protein